MHYALILFPYLTLSFCIGFFKFRTRLIARNMSMGTDIVCVACMPCYQFMPSKMLCLVFLHKVCFNILEHLSAQAHSRAASCIHIHSTPQRRRNIDRPTQAHTWLPLPAPCLQAYCSLTHAAVTSQ